MWVQTEYGIYQGYVFSAPTYILSWIALLTLVNLTIKKISLEKPSSRVILLLIYISVAPATTFIGFGVFSINFAVLNILFWLIMVFVSGIIDNIAISNRITPLSGKLFFPVIVFIALLSAIILGLNSNFRLFVNLADVYDIRFETYDGNHPVYLTYFVGLSRIIIPIGIVYTITNRRYVFLLLFILSALISFSYDGGKTIFFTSIMALFIGFFYKSDNLLNLEKGFILLMIIGFIDYFLFTNFTFLYIVRRVFFVPQLINSYVYQFMQTYEPNYFSQLLRFLGENSNRVEINYHVGEMFFGDPNMSANSGLISDSIWQLGILGIIVYPILISLYLKLCDLVLKRLDFSILTVLSLSIAYYLNNSGIIAAMFSHGLLLVLLLIILFKDQNLSQSNLTKGMRF